MLLQKPCHPSTKAGKPHFYFGGPRACPALRRENFAALACDKTCRAASRKGTSMQLRAPPLHYKATDARCQGKLQACGIYFHILFSGAAGMLAFCAFNGGGRLRPGLPPASEAALEHALCASTRRPAGLHPEPPPRFKVIAPLLRPPRCLSPLCSAPGQTASGIRAMAARTGRPRP